MPRLLDQVRAQDTALATLRRALRDGRVHHALLFDGPPGVGKEMAAFGLAQALVCEKPVEGAACGECSACGRALLREGEKRPVHPDVVVLERGLYEPAQIGRRTPETQDLSIDQVRTLVLARAAYAPHEGRAKVFIIRRAEELNASAANALLKTLEEPGKGTHFILMSSQPDVLLPTIRSRTLRIRFGALPDALVTELLAARGVEDAANVAKLAQGSMTTALGIADPDATERRTKFVDLAKKALAAKSLAPALAVAEDAKKDKGALEPGLLALASALALDARAAAGDKTRAADVAAARHRLILTALEQLDGNSNPQLTAESLLIRMRAL